MARTKEKGKKAKKDKFNNKQKNTGKINKNKKQGFKNDKRTNKQKKSQKNELNISKTGSGKNKAVEPPKIVKPQIISKPIELPESLKKVSKTASLRERMMKRLDAARFRQMNEDLDSGKSADPRLTFGTQDHFEKYHQAYKERIQHWPSDPLDLITEWIQKKIPQNHVIADFGCGEARLAQSVPHTVHSFDLFAINDRVTACDMSNCPLPDESVDVAVFCLSLMGIDISKYVAEASRVLKRKGLLKIAEVGSRFQNNSYTSFVQKMKKFGFVSNNRVLEGNAKKNAAKQTDDVFFMFEFLKIRQMKQGKLPIVKLNPCVYKRR